MPKTLRIAFETVGQSSQDMDTSGQLDEHLVAMVSFKLYVDHVDHGAYTCSIKQTPGATYVPDVPLEIGLPQPRYDGPFDYDRFAAAVRSYYADALARVIGVSGAVVVQMRNNVINMKREVSFPVADGATKAW